MIPFKSLQGHQALSRVKREFSVLQTCGSILGVPLKLQLVRQASFLRCEGKVGIPLDLKKGNQPSSRDEVGNTGPFSSYSANRDSS